MLMLNLAEDLRLRGTRLDEAATLFREALERSTADGDLRGAAKVGVRHQQPLRGPPTPQSADRPPVAAFIRFTQPRNDDRLLPPPPFSSDRRPPGAWETSA